MEESIEKETEDALKKLTEELKEKIKEYISKRADIETTGPPPLKTLEIAGWGTVGAEIFIKEEVNYTEVLVVPLGGCPLGEVLKRFFSSVASESQSLGETVETVVVISKKGEPEEELRPSREGDLERAKRLLVKELEKTRYSLIEIIRKNLDYKEKIAKGRGYDEETKEHVETHIERVKRDLKLLKDPYFCSQADEEEKIKELINELNEIAKKQGRGYEYVKVGDELEIPAKGKFRVARIGTSFSLKEMKRCFFHSGSNAYDFSPSDQQLLPLCYLLKKISSGSIDREG